MVRAEENSKPRDKGDQRGSRVSHLRSAIRDGSTSSHAGRWSSGHPLLFPVTLTAFGKDPLLADALSPTDIRIPYSLHLAGKGREG
jgi:hypothetical protein